MEIIELKHPIIDNNISIVRNEKTNTKGFREAIKQMSMLLCYEATRDIATKEISIKTPIQETNGKIIDENSVVFVPVLRAGMGMVTGVTELLPNAQVGVIGLYRNEETLKPVKYYFKLPSNAKEKQVILLDPMLATGGSGIDSIEMLKNEGIKNIKFLCIIAAPEGIKKIQETHPDVQVYCAKIDSHLNEIGYIVPGLGDAGDRIFGTI